MNKCKYYGIEVENSEQLERHHREDCEGLDECSSCGCRTDCIMQANDGSQVCESCLDTINLEYKEDFD